MELKYVYLFFCMLQLAAGNYWKRNGDDVCVASDVIITPSYALTTFTPLVIDLSFPPSVKVEETFFVSVSVYNVLNTFLPVSIEVEKNSVYEVLSVPCSVCVPPHDNVSVIVTLKAILGGNTNLSVSASIDANYPSRCGPEVAVSKSYHITSPIHIAFPGYLAERTWSLYICSYDLNGRNFIPLEGLQAPTATVPNSARAWMTLSGDLLGTPLRNMDHLIRLPSGCGEQRMAIHAPNIFFLQYLNASRQITPEKVTLLTDYIREGYEVQRSRHRLSDGSFSFFSSRNGSTWLTAFVLKTFSLSTLFISVDPTDISSAKDWLKSQQLSNGCFNRVGHVHNRIMRALNNGGTPGAMTAYVTISLLEALEHPRDPVILNAMSCIAAATAPGTEGADNLYLLALKAYAYSLARFDEAEATIGELFEWSSESDDGMYWRINSNGRINIPLSIETTSYALLSILALNLQGVHEETRRIVRWLITTMNSNGGFQSTQDTVMALQALSFFAVHEFLEPPDLTLRLLGVGNMEKRVYITESNKLESQRVDVERLPTYPSVIVEGSGCFVIQGSLQYNIKDDEPSEVFTLRVTVEPDYRARSCPAYRIEVCVAYHLVNLPSNMGMVEVSLVSGYSPDVEDLNLIGSIEQYEVIDSEVIFYFEEFTSEETCIQFTAIRESVVENPQSGTVKAYDYYEPDFFVSQPLQFRKVICSN
ncbi:Alpha-2-macroglobulin thiol-ester bond-forming [Trinorchestia longiramus]|nr:Alpha-2-macroglobulin thiol-ester bond-forming [Trinorchestia longiramus]